MRPLAPEQRSAACRVALSGHKVPRVWLAQQLGAFGAGKGEEHVLKIDFI